VTAAVGLSGVTKRFGEVIAVDDISLEIEKGQFVTLLGPSGCGKTTLLRIVAGLEYVSSGDVRLDGRRVTDTSAQRRGVGFAFQRYALFPHLTVLENVAFGLRVRRVGRGERRKRALEMLELVHLSHLVDRLPAEISGGQAQRVALARALAPEPSVLLLDEPLTALDLAVRQAMQEELRRIHRELSTTFVFVTHDQGEALTMSDRILLMRDGRIVQDGTPYQLYREPNSLFSATFIGEANAWSGRALVPREQGELCQVRIDGMPKLEARAATTLLKDDEVTYVLRPERIGFQEGEACSVRGRVEDVLPRGARAIVIASAEGGPRIRVEVGSEVATQLHPGEELRLSWEPKEAVVYAIAKQEARADAD
jgi:spermidine/putrescine transport system ATP-binding protein